MPVMLQPDELRWRLVFCQVRSEFAFRCCCVCSFVPCSGKQRLRLHPLAGAEADASEQAAAGASQHLCLDSRGCASRCAARAGPKAEGEVQPVISGSWAEVTGVAVQRFAPSAHSGGLRL